MNPYAFKNIVKPPQPKEAIDPETTNRVLPDILKICSLRRTFASIIKNVNEIDQRIDHDVPHQVWINVKIEMKSSQEAQYGRIYAPSVKCLGDGFDEKSESERRNMAMHRRLVLATAAKEEML